MKLTELVTAAQKGDSFAIEQLYEKYYNEIYKITYDFTGNHYTAEDITSDVFVSMICRIGTLKKTTAFSSWLKSVAVNKCRNYLRDNRESPSLNGIIINPAYRNRIFEKEFSFHPFEILDAKETRDTVNCIVKDLPPKHREVVIMHYYKRMTIKEISFALKLKTGTVKSRLSYARTSIERKYLSHKKRE